MSPLAKKKLLAQVSKAESSHCHNRHGANLSASPEPPTPATNPHLDEQRSPDPSGAQDPGPSTRSEVGPIPGGRDTQPCPRGEDGAPAPTVFTGCFHAYRSEALKPLGCQPLCGYFPTLKDFLEPTSSFPSTRPEEQEQPQDLRSKAGQPWSGESRRAAGKGCWVPVGAGFSPALPRGKRGREEEEAAFSTKLRAVSPFLMENDSRDTGTSSPRGLAKPRAVVASPGYPTAVPPDGYKGAALHFPLSFGSPLEHLRTQGVPAAPSLSLHPFIIPAFPSPLIATSTQPSDPCRPLATGHGHYPASYQGSLRHRYPVAPWHSQPAYSSPHVPAFHRHAKL
ncbi:ARI5A protein, partial [Brachypteracias leptosomus]|nr:ARI5A protein [Brachypteracias leptosomus]